MIYVGIDHTKHNHFTSAPAADGEVPVESLKFSNNGDSFRLLSSRPYELWEDSLITGIESTVHYGNNLVKLCVFGCFWSVPFISTYCLLRIGCLFFQNPDYII